MLNHHLEKKDRIRLGWLELPLDEYSNKNPLDTIEVIDLWSKALPPFNEDRLNAKYSIMHGQAPTPAEEEAWRK